MLGALRPHSCFLYFQKARIGETKPRPARRRIDSTPSSTSTSLSLPRLVLAGTGFSRLSFTSPFFDPASRQDPRCNFCISNFIRLISVACSNFHYDSPTPSRHWRPQNLLDGRRSRRFRGRECGFPDAGARGCRFTGVADVWGIGASISYLCLKLY